MNQISNPQSSILRIAAAEGDIWDRFTVSDVEIVRRSVGPLQLFFKRTANEIWLATDRSQMETPEISEFTWARWAFKKPITELILQPLMPDKQVVIRPEFTFRLAAGAGATVYTRIPVWTGVFTQGSEKQKLIEFPTIELSKTWFGDFLDGTLCYWVSTAARREITPEIFQPHTAICTLNIRNESEGDLQIEKLALRVERLSLYELDGQLYSDDMDIRYKGGDQHSDISMLGKAPAIAAKARLITPPRNPQKLGIAERTFKMLSEIPGFS